MFATLPLVLAVAAWLTPGSLAMRPERVQALADATPEVAVYSEANRSAMASPRDVTQGSLRTVLASGIANSAGLDPAMSGMVAHVLLTYPLVMNPGVAFSLSALSKGAELVNLRSSMPDSVALLEDYQSKGLTLLESFAVSKGDPPTTTEVDLTDDQVKAVGGLALLMGSMLIFLLILAAGPLIGSCLMLWCHKSNVNDMRPSFPDPVPEEVSMAEAPHDFHEGLFSCIGPNSTCMYAFFCPWVRHADTLGGAGVMSYWIVILVFMFSGTAAGLAVEMAKTAGIAIEEETALQIIMALLFGYARMKLRAKCGAPSKIVWMDFLYWWCCMPCSIGQEGMEVDRAQGVEVRCCCKLYDRSTGQLVGLPVKGGDED